MKRNLAQTNKYVKPSFLDDDYDHLQQEGDLSDDDFLPDYFVKEETPKIKRNPISINLPWLINGVPEMEIKTRFIGDQIFSRLKVHKGEILEHLVKIYRAVLLSAADSDFDFIKEYCEETFYDKLIRRIKQLDKSGISMAVKEDMYADKGKPMDIEANMYDSTVIKGLTLTRKENGSEDDYFISNDIENMGFISYIPKYLTRPENFVDPKKNKFMHDDAHIIIFRAYVNIKCGYKIHLYDQKGNEMFEYPEDYSWRHVAVFESEMSPPDRFNKWSLSENQMEWITKHTFGAWKMVDLDNWLVGNPLVIPRFEVRARTYSEIDDMAM